jgi:transcriptional regulator with XRE-family HTH domain
MNNKLIQVIAGKVIRKHRQALGYSQEAFADAVGFHRTYMGSVERGERNISLQNLARITTSLHITLSAFFAEVENEMDLNKNDE